MLAFSNDYYGPIFRAMQFVELFCAYIFCSKFGFNMRNDIAHGLVPDKQFNSYKVLYTWWFILKMCYMFCGKLQIDNRIK